MSAISIISIFILIIACVWYMYTDHLFSQETDIYGSKNHLFSNFNNKTMEAIEHRIIKVNGINMHVAEMGPVNGPVILFIHGFPELWYTWRHQIVAMASLGYRAVAPDLRGFGDSDSPEDPRSYTVLHHVGDLIGLLDVVAAGQEKVFVVGHDWGAYMAWFLSVFRPDRVRALVSLTVSFPPRNPRGKSVPTLRSLYGDDYYMCRFQEAGDIEAEFAELGTERVMKEFLAYRHPGPLLLPKGKAFSRSPENPLVLPSWLTEEDAQYYIDKFEKTGFTGGLNIYRNLDLNWELTAPWTGAKVKVPAKYIVGDQDIGYNSLGTKAYIEKGGFKRDVPFLEEIVIMEGVAHFINEEKPEEISNNIEGNINKISDAGLRRLVKMHQQIGREIYKKGI